VKFDEKCIPTPLKWRIDPLQPQERAFCDGLADGGGGGNFDISKKCRCHRIILPFGRVLTRQKNVPPSLRSKIGCGALWRAFGAFAG
jgi:hypothetical protein